VVNRDVDYSCRSGKKVRKEKESGEVWGGVKRIRIRPISKKERAKIRRKEISRAEWRLSFAGEGSKGMSGRELGGGAEEKISGIWRDQEGLLGVAYADEGGSARGAKTGFRKL